MIPKSYTIVLENPSTGVVRHFTIPVRPILAVMALFLSFPLLFGLAVRWSAHAEMQALRDRVETATMENASYRAATAELAGQITALQDTVADLSKRASLDP